MCERKATGKVTTYPTTATTQARAGVAEARESAAAGAAAGFDNGTEVGVLSDLWLRVGWNQKYSYTMSWQGVPMIQLPEDIVRYQEVVHSLKPDVVVETGIAHGGSLVLSASLLKLWRLLVPRG